MNIKNKVLAALALAVFVLPVMAFAQSVPSQTGILQAQIAALKAQLQTLEAQLQTQTGGGTAWCYTFTDNLSIGMTGSGVTALRPRFRRTGNP